MRRREIPVSGIAQLALVGVLTALSIGYAGLGIRSCLLIAITLALLVPLMVGSMRGAIDLFEPLVLCTVALGVMFIGRPLVDLATDKTMHLGYDIMPTFNVALMVVLIGITAFQLGYHSRFPVRWAKRLPKAAVFRPGKAVAAAWMFFFAGGALFAIFLARDGGLSLLRLLLKGRSSQDNGIYLASTGYFYNGISMWAASALIFFALMLQT